MESENISRGVGVKQEDQVKALIWRMVCSVVDTPSEVVVETMKENGFTLYRVRVESNEVGQVIGKQGRTARALRTILAAIAIKEKRRIELDIATGSAQSPAVQIQEAQV
jgi:predicted RNA-binding protein YlqC (UPF0109 family)